LGSPERQKGISPSSSPLLPVGRLSEDLGSSPPPLSEDLGSWYRKTWGIAIGRLGEFAPSPIGRLGELVSEDLGRKGPLYRKTWGVCAGESASPSQAGLTLLLIKVFNQKRGAYLLKMIDHQGAGAIL
jgi:hypothetical protein